MKSGTGTVSPPGHWSERGTGRVESERVDVLIMTAVKDEYDAVLKVDAGASPESRWEVRPGPTGLDVAFRSFQTMEGGTLRVAVTRAPEMGGLATAISASPLVDAYTPKCLAMCGVCAGREGKTRLGDVIIADRLWAYDTGKVEADIGAAGQRRERVLRDISTYQLAAEWKQKAESFKPPADSPWLRERPQTYEAQRDWVLERLIAGEEPPKHPDWKRRCADYPDVLGQLWKDGWLEDGTLHLMEAGRRHIERQRMLYPKELPEAEPFRVHVGPIATGSKVVEDTTIFDTLAEPLRTVLGLEMEGSAIGALAHFRRIPFMVVMKGVMDFARAGKDDHFKPFAARASAECLLAFVRAHLGSTVETVSPKEDFRDLLDPSTSLPPTRPSPAALLNARHRLIPFIEQGRTELLAELRSWCEGEEPVSARVFHGAGGVGKTRLLIEWSERLRVEGWRAGFLVRGADPARFEALVSSVRPTLVVIDYAESRTQLEALLQLVARRRHTAAGGRLRVVLLARSVGDWFHALQTGDWLIQDLLNDAPPLEVGAESTPAAERKALFQQAVERFAELRGRMPPGTPPPALEDACFERILYIHMAALAAIEGLPFTAQGLMENVLDHEERFWLAAGPPQPRTEKEKRLFQERMRRAVAALTLRGGVERRSEAETLLAHLGADEELLLLHDVYPGGGQESGGAYVGGLEPDLLGDAMVLRVLLREGADAGTFLERVFEGAGERAVRSGFELLGRLSVEHAEKAGEWMSALLEGDNEGRAVAALEAAKALGQHTAHAMLGVRLAEVLEHKGSIELAVRMNQAGLPADTVSLREVALWVARALMHVLPEADAPGLAVLRAQLLLNLGERQGRLARSDAAREALQQAVELLRGQLTQEQEALPLYAVVLVSLGNELSILGRREAALEMARRALELGRELVEKRGESFRALLGRSLNFLGSRLLDSEQWPETLETFREAQVLHQELAEAGVPTAHVPWALSLLGVGLAQGALGDFEAALVAERKAVEMLRARTKARPDETLHLLALGLVNLGKSHIDLEQWDEALAITQEAENLYRRLAERRPDVFRSEWACSLNNLGVCQSELEQHEAALESSQQAVALYRHLSDSTPGSFLSDLAMSLRNLGLRQAESNRYYDACNTLREAVSLYQKLEDLGSSHASPDLALTLACLGAAYGELRRWGAARKAMEGAAPAFRELAKSQPNPFKPLLADLLRILARAQSEGVESSVALRTVSEAVMLFREWSGVEPDGSRKKFASALHLQSQLQATLGLWRDAQASANAALDEIWPLFMEQPKRNQEGTRRYLQQVLECLKQLGDKPSKALRERMQTFQTLLKP